MLASQILNAI